MEPTEERGRQVNEEIMREQEEVFLNEGELEVDDEQRQELVTEQLRQDFIEVLSLSEQLLDGGEEDVVVMEGTVGTEEIEMPRVELESQKELRKLIINIRNDDNLKPEEKSIKIQELMTNQWSEKEKKSVASSLNEFDSNSSQDDFKPTYNEKTNNLGCNHYIRGTRIQAECCKGWFTCRLCHDDVSDHKIDRTATKNMMCMHCLTVQPVSKNCNNCETQLGRYYCDKCKFWDDDSNKNTYHCDKCGLCRKGKGLGIDYFHCDTCACCLGISTKGSHQCIEKNLDRDCMICGEYLFTSTSDVIYMKCNHAIHQKCFDEYTLTAYQCPTCWKSVVNMRFYFNRIDALVAQQKMPVEYENYVSKILCNDCVKQSTVKYHFLYHKCPYCKGYNTKVVETKELSTHEELNNNNSLVESINNESGTADSSSNDVGNNGIASSSTDNNVSSDGSTPNGEISIGSQVRQSRVLEVNAMMQGEDGPIDRGNATEHGTRNPLNSLESNNI